jgi:hypothetical protein
MPAGFIDAANSPVLSGGASRHGVHTGSPASKVIPVPEAVLMPSQLSYAVLTPRRYERYANLKK